MLQIVNSIYIQIWRLPLWDLLVLHSTSLLPLGLCRRGAGCVRMQTQIEKVCVWTFQRQTYCYKPIGTHIWPICCVKFPRKSADGIRVARLRGSADAAKPELGPLEVDLEETSPPKLPRQGDGWDSEKRKIKTVKTGSVWIPWIIAKSTLIEAWHESSAFTNNAEAEFSVILGRLTPSAIIGSHM